MNIKLKDINSDRIERALFSFCKLHNINVGSNVNLVVSYLKVNKGSMYIDSFERLLERYPDNSTLNCPRTLQGHFFSRLIDEFFKNNRLSGIDDKADEDDSIYLNEDGTYRSTEEQERLYKERHPENYDLIMRNGFKKTYDEYLCTFKGKKGTGIRSIMLLTSLHDYLIRADRLQVNEFTMAEMEDKTKELKEWNISRQTKPKDKLGLPIEDFIPKDHNSHEWRKASLVALKFDKEFE